MKRYIYTAVVLLAATFSAGAQTNVVSQLGGELVGAANMKHTDAAKFSQTEYSYLSARVSAMGGAFTSLGADLSSMTINPAGLGMYRSSSMGFSAALGVSDFSNDMNTAGSSKTKFSFNQVGLALNLYQGSGSLVSYTFGFAYNKLADLNYKSSYSWQDNVSMADFFAAQMYGINSSALSSSADPFRNNDIYLDEWGGVLAYQMRLIDPVSGSSDDYEVNAIGSNAVIYPRMSSNSRGSVGEYDLSSGFNVANVLYLGFTLGIQDIYQRITYNYSETYDHNLTATQNPNDYLRSMLYNPIESSNGSGINVKIGAIVRPVNSLRLGIAYHSPTWVSLTREYDAYMKTIFGDGEVIEGTSLLNSYTYSYSSPNKLLFGASYAFGNRALISADYDVVWYNDMRMHEDYDSLNDAFANDVKYDFGASHNYRLGLEVRPLDNLYLRGGYAYYGTPFNSDAMKEVNNGNPFFGLYKTYTDNISLGAGVRFPSGSTLDFAWVMSNAHYTNHYLYYFYYQRTGDTPLTMNVNSPAIKDSKQTKNLISATYTMHF